MVPEAEDPNVAGGEECIAGGIANLCADGAVCAAVEFDGNARASAVKIEEIRPARILPTELVIREVAVAKNFSETLFSDVAAFSQVPSKFPSILCAVSIAMRWIVVWH
jgi:hypothetical protein